MIATLKAGTFCYGYVDMDWQIGYARCRNLNDLKTYSKVVTMTYNEFRLICKLVIWLRYVQKDIAYGDSCVMIVINKEITRAKRPIW